MMNYDKLVKACHPFHTPPPDRSMKKRKGLWVWVVRWGFYGDRIDLSVGENMPGPNAGGYADSGFDFADNELCYKHGRRIFPGLKVGKPVRRFIPQSEAQ